MVPPGEETGHSFEVRLALQELAFTNINRIVDELKTDIKELRHEQASMRRANIGVWASVSVAAIALAVNAVLLVAG